ncbi:MAG: FimV/HubP family polar landmark protein [Pseudomonadota bacterium]
MKNPGHWRMGALASAVALLGGLASFDVAALGLGRITVQSALGEPLRAEIDISDINADEANSLRAGVASADAFRAAGLEYTPAVVGMQVSLQKRADGRAFLRLTTSRPVTEPFVDLVLEANWSSGRIVRDYTMLFDPPSLRANVAPTAPVFTRPATPPPVAPPAGGIASIPYSPPTQPAVRVVPPPSAPVVQRPSPPPRPPALARAPAGGNQVTVKAGDTAGAIAAQTKPASISLDQMLLALLRSNPDAFIAGNINRLKSGALLDIPSAEDAASVAPGEASRTIVAQSRDFNDFRRKLADGVPATQVGSSNRQATGKLQARVEDRAPAAATPDKLTLSKGSVQGKSAAEEKIAKERETKAASDRVAELSKNISDLSKLAGTGAAGAASAASGSGVAVARPNAVPASAAAPATSAASAATAAASPASATTATVAPAASSPAGMPSAPESPAIVASASMASATQAPASAAVKKPVVPPPAPPPEPSLVDELLDNPFVLPGLGALLVLIAGLGFYRYKKRNNAVQVDSSFLESRLQPDSFFGASGGQRIDTNEGGATGSSLVYSPSQLDAAGDVDPVAEADVYLAYGRDLQAEEILKEAMRTNPARVAIHSKLMEIYAKRRDIKAFEVVAIEAYNLTRGDGPEWAYIGEMGRDLDPSNPLYQPGGQPNMAEKGAEDSHGDGPGFGSSTIPQPIEPQIEEPVAGAVDFDLDLDFSLGDEPEPEAIAPAQPPVAANAEYQPEPTVAIKAVPDPIFDGLDMDFSTGTVVLEPTQEPEPAEAPTLPDLDTSADMALSASGLTFTTEPLPEVKPAAASTSAAVTDNGMLEFDLGSLSLDLDSPTPTLGTTEVPASVVDTADDPLATKLALAEEFQALGDMDGARSLAEEVASQSSGPLKSRAQAFLNALS